MSRVDVNTIEHTVTARKPFPCEDYPPCGRTVQVGEDYLRAVAFPGSDANLDGPAPWVLRLCRSCATKYGRQMPPRRGRKPRTETP